MTDLPQVKVWSIDLGDPQWSGLSQCVWLDRQERDRAQRFLSSQDARRFVASHVAMRRILAHECQCRPDEITYKYNAWGKPWLAGGPEFSLSHSAERAVLAVAEQPVGIDIEFDERMVSLDWFEPVWSSAERKRFGNSTLSTARLLAIWKRKEAAVKALGRGLSQPLSEVVVPIAPNLEGEGRWCLIRMSDRVRVLHCREIMVDGLTACVATTTRSSVKLQQTTSPASL